MNELNITIKVIRSNRKTLSMEMKPDGLYIRAPRRMSDQQIQQFVESKKGWIQKHWKQMEERNAAVNSLPPFTQEEVRALAEKALDVIPQKVKYYAEIIGVKYGRITIRNQRTRWGSCSSKGNLNFNCLLMLFPDEIIDSVVVHELCHLKHMNHSSEFYAEVEKAFPEYRRCHKWLNENGSMQLRRLP